MPKVVPRGYLAIVLTAHVPYLRSSEATAYHEDELHETTASSLIPILNTLFHLRDAHIKPIVSLAFSPVFLDQLNDPSVQQRFISWMKRWIEAKQSALIYWNNQQAAHISYLTQFYIDWGQNILTAFTENYGANLMSALRELCVEGAEPLACAATPSYLPMLDRASIAMQLHVGQFSVAHHFMQAPHTLWLAGYGYYNSMLSDILQSNIRTIILDPHRMADETTHHFSIGLLNKTRLKVMSYDEHLLEHVWPAEIGYAGDALYRSGQHDVHTKLPLWRTGLPGTGTELYEPYDAFRRAAEHGRHFASVVISALDHYFVSHQHPGIAIIPIDIELLGRNWFEGPIWLRSVIEHINEHPRIVLTSPNSYQHRYPTHSEWQLVNDHRLHNGGKQPWNIPNGPRLPMALRDLAQRIQVLVKAWPDATGIREQALNQTVRELLLAQSLDWTGIKQRHFSQSMLQRSQVHLQRAEQLCAMLEDAYISTSNRDILAAFEALDNPFPHINYRTFAV